MKRKGLTLCILALAVNLTFIWGSSLMDGETSAAFSGFVGRLLGSIFPSAELAPGERGQGLLRKLAHFTEFCTLGMLLSWLMQLLRSKRLFGMLLALAGGSLVACLDETIQLFVPGRAGLLTDVGIDTLGCALGIVLITLMNYKKIKNLEETKL